MSDESTLEGVSNFIDSLKKLNKATNGEETSNTPEPAPIEFPLNFRFETWPNRRPDFRRAAIGFIEQFYYDHKKLPVREDFETRFSKEELPKTFGAWKAFLTELQEPLEARGLPVFEQTHDWLEPEFITAVTYICNFHDKRTLPAKLKEIGVTTKKWNAWLTKENYRAYFERRLDEVVDHNSKAMAKIGLNQLLANGDLAAIKYFHELENIYRPQSTQNLFLIMQAIMEILAKYVKQDVLNQIASELRGSSIIAGELSQ